MKHLKKMMLICSVLILGIIACFGNVFTLPTLTASAETSTLTLHEKTKYNSKQEYINDNNSQPTITVFIMVAILAFINLKVGDKRD